MTMRRQLLGLLAVPLLLAGCGSAEATLQPTAAAESSAAHGPPERAAMVCGPEIAGSVTQILHLDDPPHAVTDWTDDVYTCTYHLPMGPLVLTVNVSDDDGQADSYFDAQRAAHPDAEDFVGLGERAYRSGAGDVTVVKDDMTLTVDATGLPETFGENGQKRTALAFEVASQVLGCWVEHG
jgi:hypothetical protein